MAGDGSSSKSPASNAHHLTNSSTSSTNTTDSYQSSSKPFLHSLHTAPHITSGVLPSLITTSSTHSSTTPEMDKFAPTKESWIDLQNTVYPAIRFGSVSIAAICAAFTGVMFGYPFDSIKTRMQAYIYPSTIACIQQTYAQEGFKGFYRGVLPVAVTVSSLRSISFSVYFKSKDEFLKLLPNIGVMAEGSTARISAASFFAGGTTGMFMAALSAPMELVKVQRQLEQAPSSTSMLKTPTIATTSVSTATQSASIHSASTTNSLLATKSASTGKTTWQWFKHIYRTKGLQGFAIGFHVQIARDFLGTALYFSIYETFKIWATPVDEVPGPMIHMLGGGFAGSLSWLFLFPLDVIKSVFQQDAFKPHPQYRRAVDFIRERFVRQGIRGFYQGIGPQLIRSFPLHSLNFLVYEHMLKVCKNIGLNTQKEVGSSRDC
ncbi:hypothetical protein O5D80_006777 [Batrachochytrium dendrobatidis]|nr:hypothetical protein O5D80_006777 [Batrachochytrium dendrobatidis]